MPCTALAFDTPEPLEITLDDEARSWLFGRSGSCDVVLSDPRISRRHALLSHRGGLCVVRDLRATNGIFVTGERVVVARLGPGDERVLGAAVRATLR